jgi:hypothetical protein
MRRVRQYTRTAADRRGSLPVFGRTEPAPEMRRRPCLPIRPMPFSTSREILRNAERCKKSGGRISCAHVTEASSRFPSGMTIKEKLPLSYLLIQAFTRGLLPRCIRRNGASCSGRIWQDLARHSLQTNAYETFFFGALPSYADELAPLGLSRP